MGNHRNIYCGDGSSSSLLCTRFKLCGCQNPGSASCSWFTNRTVDRHFGVVCFQAGYYLVAVISSFTIRKPYPNRNLLHQIIELAIQIHAQRLLCLDLELGLVSRGAVINFVEADLFIEFARPNIGRGKWVSERWPSVHYIG